MEVRVFELIQKQKILDLDHDQQVFIAKMITKEVERAAAETGKTPEEVYTLYAKGLYGADRTIEVDFLSEKDLK